MSKKLGTSDIHFGHANILKMSDRLRHMEEAGYPLDIRHYQRLMAGEATPEDKAIINKLHNDWLVEHLNSQIDDGDVVYHTGDFSFYKKAEDIRNVLSRLRGTWHFIFGNHDNQSALREACKGTKHLVLGDYHTAHVNKKRVIMFHYPIQDWDQAHRGSYMLHGHLHGTDGHGEHKVHKIPNRYDIGLDAHPECLMFNLEDLVV